MILDRGLFYSFNQAVTTTANSTSSLNMGYGDSGIIDNLYVNVIATSTFAAVGSATLTITLQVSDDDATFTNTPVTVTIPKDSMTVGADLLKIKLPYGMKKYSRLVYTVATGPFTAGTLHAFISDGVDAQQIYPSKIPSMQ
jgi:hypothetical protein